MTMKYYNRKNSLFSNSQRAGRVSQNNWQQYIWQILYLFRARVHPLRNLHSTIAWSCFTVGKNDKHKRYFCWADNPWKSNFTITSMGPSPSQWECGSWWECLQHTPDRNINKIHVLVWKYSRYAVVAETARIIRLAFIYRKVFQRVTLKISISDPVIS
jgi:hypothetical protein